MLGRVSIQPPFQTSKWLWKVMDCSDFKAWWFLILVRSSPEKTISPTRLTLLLILPNSQLTSYQSKLSKQTARERPLLALNLPMRYINLCKVHPNLLVRIPQFLKSCSISSLRIFQLNKIWSKIRELLLMWSSDAKTPWRDPIRDSVRLSDWT